jgi:hypothetical protein
MLTDADKHALEARIHELEKCWSDMDLLRIRSLWDDRSPPLYLAEEAPGPALQWEQLEQYWRNTQNGLPFVGIRTSNYRFHELSSEYASVFYDMHWDGRLPDGRALGGDNRVCATFRKRADGWFFVQYIEAPLAPIVYMRQLYERSVTPGFQ